MIVLDSHILMKIYYLIFYYHVLLAYIAILLFLGQSNPSTLVCYLHNLIYLNLMKISTEAY